MNCRFLAGLTAAAACSFSSSFAFAQDAQPTTPPAASQPTGDALATTPSAAASSNATTSTESASTAAAAANSAEPLPEPRIRASVAIERIGGLSYTNLRTGEQSNVLGGYVIGGPSANPDTSPRLGVDAVFASNLTLGAALAGGTYRLTSSSGDRSSTDELNLFILAPRIGYRIPLNKHWDLTPRAVVTLEGGSISTDHDRSKDAILALALGAEGVVAYRATSSFNLLAGVGFDHTVAASTSHERERRSFNGATTKEEGSESPDGSLFTLQLWLGIGGYL